MLPAKKKKFTFRNCIFGLDLQKRRKKEGKRELWLSKLKPLTKSYSFAVILLSHYKSLFRDWVQNNVGVIKHILFSFPVKQRMFTDLNELRRATDTNIKCLLNKSTLKEHKENLPTDFKVKSVSLFKDGKVGCTRITIFYTFLIYLLICSEAELKRNILVANKKRENATCWNSTLSKSSSFIVIFLYQYKQIFKIFTTNQHRVIKTHFIHIMYSLYEVFS